mgnify:CR=1 FL=1
MKARRGPPPGGGPALSERELALGVDLVANISRFLAYIIDHAVRFTVKGEIFKTTEKRILQKYATDTGLMPRAEAPSAGG